MIAWLERNQFLALGLGGLFLVAGLIAGDVLGGDDPQPIVFQSSPGMTLGAPIRVHVAGSVASPGVYEMRGGDRVEDAVAAAGGPAPDADLDAVNLARRLRDGEQILIPGLSPAAAGGGCEAGLIDLNVATEELLVCLPGIGPAYARRIVDSREVDGPFASVEDLAARNLLPAATLDAVLSLVTVSQP